MTTPEIEEIVKEFDVFLEPYTGKHEDTFELAKVLFADTVRVRKDLILIEFQKVVTTLTAKHQEDIEKAVEAERERIKSKIAKLKNKCGWGVTMSYHDTIDEVLHALTPTKTDNQTEV